MNRIVKRGILIALSLVILAASSWAFFILKEPFLREVMVHWFQSFFVSTTPDWKTYNSPDGELFLDSPFLINWERKGFIKKNGKGFQTTYGKSQPNRTGFHVHINSARYINLNISPSEKETEDIMKQTFQNYAKFEWKEQAVTCSSLPATLATYAFELNGNLFHFNDLMVCTKNQSWKIQTSSYQKNTDTFNEWTKRMIESIKIKMKDS